MRGAIRSLLRPFDLDLISISSGRTLSGRLRTLIRQQEIDCVLDVGANIGQYGASLRANGYKETIISFEPAAGSFRALEEKAAKDESWHVQRLALGTSNEEMILNVMQGTALSSFHEPNEYGKQCFADESIDHQEKVPVRRLESVVSTMEPFKKAKNVFLKIDAQGHDLEVLRGAMGFLPKVALLQMELSIIPIYTGVPDWRDVITEVQNAGFVIAGLFAPFYRHGREIVELDGLFLRHQ